VPTNGDHGRHLALAGINYKKNGWQFIGQTRFDYVCAFACCCNSGSVQKIALP